MESIQDYDAGGFKVSYGRASTTARSSSTWTIISRPEVRTLAQPSAPAVMAYFFRHSVVPPGLVFENNAGVLELLADLVARA